MSREKFTFRDISGRRYGCKWNDGKMWLFMLRNGDWEAINPVEKEEVLNNYRQLAEKQNKDALQTTTT